MVLAAWVRTATRALAFLGAAVCLYAMRQADPDLWGYLAYGRLFVEHGAIVHQDPFAYTSGPYHWVTFEYGAHLLLWWAFQYGGTLGLIGLKCVLGGIALYCLYDAIRLTCDEPFVWVPTFLLCTSAVSRFFLFRPQLFTFACFALFVTVLLRFILRRRAPLWLLPAAMLLWVNTHGGFVAGLAAIALAILLRVSENVRMRPWRHPALLAGTKPLWAALGACTLVTFINPLGVRLWAYVLTELTHGTNRRYIAEWAPASFATDPWSTILLTLLSATVLVVGFGAQRRHRDEPGPLPVWWAASCVPLLAMSYLSVRHVPLAAIWAGPVITLLASRLTGDLAALSAFRRLWFLLRGFALLPVCLTFAVVYAEPRPAIHTSGAVLGRTHPCRAVSFLRQNQVEGNLFNPLWWGSYITWELYPKIRVSMDGRNISLFPDEMVVENLRFYSSDATEADLDAPFRHDTDFLLVPTDRPVLARVRADRRWRQAYADRDAVIFLRADAPARPHVAALASRPLLVPADSCRSSLD